MSKKINGKTYWYVDTQYDDELIYDIYQDNYGNVIRVIVGYIF